MAFDAEAQFAREPMKFSDEYVADELIKARAEFGKVGCDFQSILKALFILADNCGPKMESFVASHINECGQRQALCFIHGLIDSEGRWIK